MWKYISASHVNQKWMLRSPLFSLCYHHVFYLSPPRSLTHIHAPVCNCLQFQFRCKACKRKPSARDKSVSTQSGRHVTSATRNCRCASRIPACHGGRQPSRSCVDAGQEKLQQHWNLWRVCRPQATAVCVWSGSLYEAERERGGCKTTIKINICLAS